MKKLVTTSIAAIAFVFTGMGATQTAKADIQDHLHRLAERIESQANTLIRETRHYRHTAHYGDLIRQVVRFRNTARHVHHTTFTSSSLAHLQADMRILDAAFHEIEDFFDHVEIDAAHGIGHVHGNTRHVKALLNSMEDNIHHMKDDVDSLRRAWNRSRRHHRHDIHSQIYRSGGVQIYSSPRIYGSGSGVYGTRCQGGSGRGFHFNGNGLSVNRGGLSFRIKL